MKGILYALIGYTGFAFADSTVKFLTQHYNIFQIVAFEGMVGGLFLLAISRWIGGTGDLFAKKNLPIHGLRVVFNFLICVGFTYSLSVIPLPTAYALVFTKPFMACLLGKMIYGQSLKPFQLIAILVGFAGTLLVLQPSTAGFDLVLLVPLVVTVFIALMFLVSNSLKEASIFTLGFYPLFGVFVLTLPLAIFYYEPVLPWHWGLFLFAGLGAPAGVVFVSLAFRTADASVVSPYTYSEIIWGLAFSVFIFHEALEIHVLTGAAIIIGSGLYLLWKERKAGVTHV